MPVITIRGQMGSGAPEIGLLEALTMADFVGGAPQNITIYGIEPKNMGWGFELSPEVAAVVPKVIDLILSEL
jgi:hydrogenase maturation protease